MQFFAIPQGVSRVRLAPTVKVYVYAARTAHVTTSQANACVCLDTRAGTVTEVGDSIMLENQGILMNRMETVYVLVNQFSLPL